jgi:hypothetical protein
MSLNDRLHGRSPEEMESQLQKSADSEEDVIVRWTNAHNRLQKELSLFNYEFSLKRLNERNPKYRKSYRDPGDAGAFFSDLPEKKPIIDFKPRAGYGLYFRPKVSDVRNCLKKDWAYLVIQNHHTERENLVLVRADELREIQGFDVNTHPEIYDGRPFYIVPDYRIYLHCSLNPLQPVDSYKQILEYIRGLNSHAYSRDY